MNPEEEQPISPDPKGLIYTRDILTAVGVPPFSLLSSEGRAENVFGIGSNEGPYESLYPLRPFLDIEKITGLLYRVDDLEFDKLAPQVFCAISIRTMSPEAMAALFKATRTASNQEDYARVSGSEVIGRANRILIAIARAGEKDLETLFKEHDAPGRPALLLQVLSQLGDSKDPFNDIFPPRQLHIAFINGAISLGAKWVAQYGDGSPIFEYTVGEITKNEKNQIDSLVDAMEKDPSTSALLLNAIVFCTSTAEPSSVAFASSLAEGILLRGGKIIDSFLKQIFFSLNSSSEDEAIHLGSFFGNFGTYLRKESTRISETYSQKEYRDASVLVTASLVDLARSLYSRIMDKEAPLENLERNMAQFVAESSAVLNIPMNLFSAGESPSPLYIKRRMEALESDTATREGSLLSSGDVLVSLGLVHALTSKKYRDESDHCEIVMALAETLGKTARFSGYAAAKIYPFLLVSTEQQVETFFTILGDCLEDREKEDLLVCKAGLLSGMRQVVSTIGLESVEKRKIVLPLLENQVSCLLGLYISEGDPPDSIDRELKQLTEVLGFQKADDALISYITRLQKKQRMPRQRSEKRPTT